MKSDSMLRSAIKADATPNRSASLKLQRQCACGMHMPGGGECEECKKGQMSLQRKSAIGSASGTVPQIVHDVLRSPGQPLDLTARAFFEPRLGHDFSTVRLHTDNLAADSARSVNATAYTVGDHIAFQTGLYNPFSLSGLGLLAHELTHVVQNRDSTAQALRSPNAISRPTDASEQEAAHAEQRIRTGGSVEIGATRGAVIQRDAADVGKAIGIGAAIAGGATALGLGVAALAGAFDSKEKKAKRLAKELRLLIAGATWKEIRKRIYPKESAAGIERAKERKAGKLPDLTGLGRISSLERFAAAVRDIQKRWGKSIGNRLRMLSSAANAELVRAERRRAEGCLHLWPAELVSPCRRRAQGLP